MKIYLSSTYEDLKEHRRTVLNALRQSGYQEIGMEDYVAQDARPVNACLENVAHADIYVGIFGLRYGYVPPPEHDNPDGLSITELEFRQANSQPGTYCLTFLLNEDDTLPPRKFIDALSEENGQGKRIKHLREYLQREKTARFFSYSKPHELASKVQTAVTKYLQEHGGNRLDNHAVTSTRTWDVAKNGPPFPGLLHFTRKYAPVFFGREAEVYEVLDRLQLPEGRFLIISGDSGTGKSSLVDAGVLPRLEEIGLRGSENCACVRMQPSHGNQPFDALVRALHDAIEGAGLNWKEIGSSLTARPDRLPTKLKTIISKGMNGAALVLFLDQMEELFVGGPEGRALTDAFLANLFAAARGGVLTVIATLRNDLLHHCYRHADMLSVLKGPGHYPLGRLAPNAMHDLIVKPARSAGVSVPNPLTQRLIEDAGTEPGNLPLLAFALRRLFDRKKGKTFNLALYDQWGGKALGGLKGAIAEHAGEVEQALCEDLHLEPKVLSARLAEIFPSLVRVDLEGLPTRRHAPMGTFRGELEPLVEALVKSRLLIPDGKGEGSRVSVAHERLFEAWPALERWVASHQDDLRTLRQAELDAAEWRWHQYDLAHIWHPERLRHLQTLLERFPAGRATQELREFAQPQLQLINLLENEKLSHEERRSVGGYLVELGDPRKGTGVSAKGTPDIDWVSVNGGRVVLVGDALNKTLENFKIARYPVTNAQFQAFIDAEDGYSNAAWWKDLKEQEPTKPRWSEVSAPRETVSWYQAVAFCRWLSDRLGYLVRLPTVFEWQHAATNGEEKRIYPWGSLWEDNRCNSSESLLDRTTMVGLYPQGTWRGGPLDMAGNVWEWCLNKDDYPKDVQIDRSGDSRELRGGSSSHESKSCRVTAGSFYKPAYRNCDIGFRLLRPLSPDN